MRAGGAFVELFSKDGMLRKGLARAKQMVQAFGRAMIGAGKVMIGMGLSIGAPLAASVKHFINYGSQLRDMADRTGASVEMLAELGYAAGMAGGSIDDVETALRAMAKNLTSADEEGKAAQETLAALGLTIEELISLEPDKQFETIARALGKVENSTLLRGMSMKIFGKGGTKLLPALKDLDALRAEARGIPGVVPTEDEVNKADALGDAFGRLWETINGGMFSVGLALADTLQKILDTIQPVLVGISKFIQNNQQLVVVIAAVAAGLIVAGTALAAFGFAAMGVVAGISAIGSILAFVLAPKTLIILGIVAAFAALALGIYQNIRHTETFATIFGQLADTFQAVKARFLETWGGIVGAVKGGDLKLAVQIGYAAIREESTRLWKFIRVGWSNLIDGIVNLWHDLATRIAGEKWIALLSGPVGIAGALGAESPDERAARMQRQAAELQALIQKYDRDLEGLDRERRALVERGKLAGTPKETPAAAKVASLKEVQAKLPAAVKGLFQAPSYAQALGYADKSSAQNIKRTADNTAKIVDALKKIPLMSFG